MISKVTLVTAVFIILGRNIVVWIRASHNLKLLRSADFVLLVLACIQHTYLVYSRLSLSMNFFKLFCSGISDSSNRLVWSYSTISQGISLILKGLMSSSSGFLWSFEAVDLYDLQESVSLSCSVYTFRV